MARSTGTMRKATTTLVAWVIALAMFFPILWTVLTGFKTEAEAIASPPACSSSTGHSTTSSSSRNVRTISGTS